MGGDIYIKAIKFVVLLFSLSVHESAHAFSADFLGDPTARSQGRVSLNPVVHAELWGTIIFPLVGLLSNFPIFFGWAKPTPVNISLLRNPKRDEMIVAAAGPLSNFAIALGLFVFLMIVKSTSPEASAMVRDVAFGEMPEGGSSILSPLVLVAFYGVFMNLILGVFNLIPIAPLDGAAVLSGILPRSMAGVMDQIRPYGFWILMALMLLGLTNMLFEPVLTFFIQFLRV